MRFSSRLKAPSRRRFLKGASLATAAFTIVPRHVLGGPGQKAPSEKLNIAGIGIGGMGAGNLANLEGENIVALCDVNRSQAQPVFDRYKQAHQYQDFRELLEREKDLDAVLIATPDHTHAVTAMACMKKGLHVYVQKPLAHTFHGSRL
jgi:predicted dehydrogenase